MSATFHTTSGDFEISIIDIYKTPKSAKNFLALCASNYYNDCLILKNIKGFIFQTGDPSNSGNGGESIYEKVTLKRISKTNSMMN
jgi:peptidyl-prolyl cis-trans isomerase-like 3